MGWKLMNKYLMIVYAMLVLVLAALMYNPSNKEDIEVEHPAYESSYVEEFLITTYHNPANNQPMTWDDLVSNEGYDSFGKKISLDVLVQQTKDGEVCKNCLGYGLLSSNAVKEVVSPFTSPFIVLATCFLSNLMIHFAL